jgi:hypothetical protein
LGVRYIVADSTQALRATRNDASIVVFATCHDLAGSGAALSFVRYSHVYDADDIAAKQHRAGLWSGSFIAPWDWRQFRSLPVSRSAWVHRNKATIILGAASVPVNAQTILFGAAACG